MVSTPTFKFLYQLVMKMVFTDHRNFYWCWNVWENLVYCWFFYPSLKVLFIIIYPRMHICGFYLPVLLIFLIEINSSVCINQTVRCVLDVSGTDYIPIVVLKDCVSKHSNILSDFVIRCLEDVLFASEIFGKYDLLSFCLKEFCSQKPMRCKCSFVVSVAIERFVDHLQEQVTFF